MKLSIDVIKKILSNHSGKLNFTYFNDIVIEHKRLFEAQQPIVVDDLPLLIRSNIEIVEVTYNEALYNCLNKEFPGKYRFPYGKFNFMEMDRYLESLDRANLISKRKRFLYIVGDMCTANTKTYRNEIVLGHDEKLDYKRWNEVKRFINKEIKINYRNSETGIIIMVNLMDNSQGNYVEKFKQHTDLVAVMVSRVNGIAVDFVQTEDIISLTNPDELLQEYTSSNCRLIILGDTMDDEYRRVLSEVKKYDRYVRIVAVPSIDPNNIDKFFNQLKLVYNTNKWMDE